MAKPSYATDEDLVLRASADFTVLCPRDQRIASGVDGWFAASDLWTLRSTTNFATSGVLPGHVVQLSAPTTIFKAAGELFVVHAVSGSQITLRRKGMTAESGVPPGVAGGLNGVAFSIVTLDPQINRVSLDFDRRYGLTGQPGDSLLDPRDVRDAIVLMVLGAQYLAMSRDVHPDHGDTFSAKSLALKAELDDLLARLVVRTTSGTGSASRFSTRLSR